MRKLSRAWVEGAYQARKLRDAQECNISDHSQRAITMASAGLGVPIKLLHESLGHVITVELKTGQLYRGKLAEGTFHVDDLGNFI